MMDPSEDQLLRDLMADFDSRWRRRSRRDAAMVLVEAGWTAEELAKVFRWKLGYAEHIVANRPRVASDAENFAQSLYLSTRSHNAVLRLGIRSLPELSRRLDEIKSLKGVGAKTFAEIEAAAAFGSVDETLTPDNPSKT